MMKKRYMVAWALILLFIGAAIGGGLNTAFSQSWTELKDGTTVVATVTEVTTSKITISLKSPFQYVSCATTGPASPVVELNISEGP